MTKGGNRNAGTVLLELLEIVPDAEKLELMLEPANLLQILMARGRAKGAIRAELKSRLPGDLLLEVLKQEKDPEALLAFCTAPLQQDGPPSLSNAAAGAGAEPFGERSMLNKIGSFGVIVAAVIPAMLVAGFFPEWETLSTEAWVAIAAMGAAISGVGYVWGRAPWYVGALGGALAAPGALLAIYFYTRERSSVLKIEIVLAFFVGAAPGMVAYYALFKKVAR